jgi:hypothetical protein
MDIDEATLNVLLIDGEVEPATAYVASIRDTNPRRATSNARTAFDVGLLVGLVLFILYICW